MFIFFFQNHTEMRFPSYYVLVGSDLDGGSSDNCATSLTTNSVAPLDCSKVGSTIPFTLTVSDGSCNSNTCSSIVNVIDSTPPQLVCQDVTLTLSSGGSASIVIANLLVTSYEACGTPVFSLNQSSVSCANLAVAPLVRVSAVDGSGNTGTCVSHVQVRSTPSLQCPSGSSFDVSVALLSSVQYNTVDSCVAPSYTYTVISSLPVGVSLEATTGRLLGTSTNIGSVTSVVRVTDAFGQWAETSCIFVTNALPTITCPTLNAEVTALYSQTVPATGGTLPYTFDIASGALPAGFTLNATSSLIVGVPASTDSG